MKSTVKLVYVVG